VQPARHNSGNNLALFEGQSGLGALGDGSEKSEERQRRMYPVGVSAFASESGWYRHRRPALIILSAAPLSLLGVFAMLEVTGTPLNVSSFMGIILMVGWW
jgi:hypothetical protein